jgi:hypothetical protein
LGGLAQGSEQQREPEPAQLQQVQVLQRVRVPQVLVPQRARQPRFLRLRHHQRFAMVRISSSLLRRALSGSLLKSRQVDSQQFNNLLADESPT